MERTVFNNAQLEILDLMSYVENEAMLNEIRDMLSRYFAEKAQQEIDKLWEDGTINDSVVEGWKTEHMRTPCRRRGLHRECSISRKRINSTGQRRFWQNNTRNACHLLQHIAYQQRGCAGVRR